MRQVSEAIEGFPLAEMKVSREEIETASGLVPDQLKDAIREAAARIRAFHELEMPRDTE